MRIKNAKNKIKRTKAIARSPLERGIPTENKRNKQIIPMPATYQKIVFSIRSLLFYLIVLRTSSFIQPNKLYKFTWLKKQTSARFALSESGAVN
jgi:hypothetical protein